MKERTQRNNSLCDLLSKLNIFNTEPAPIDLINQKETNLDELNYLISTLPKQKYSDLTFELIAMKIDELYEKTDEITNID